MKKILIVLCIFLLCGCSAKKEEVVEESAVLEETKKEEKPDIDLSFGSETIAYATITNILEAPKEYKGQQIKMLGTYKKVESEISDSVFHVCIVTDATACCTQGLEFHLLEDGEYPVDGRQIILQGMVDTYMDGNYEVAFLKDATYKIY